MTRPSSPTALSSAQDAPRVTEAMVEAEPVALIALEKFVDAWETMRDRPPGVERKPVLDAFTEAYWSAKYTLKLAAERAALGTAATPGDEPVAPYCYAIEGDPAANADADGYFDVHIAGNDAFCVPLYVRPTNGGRSKPEPAQAGEATVSEAEVEREFDQFRIRMGEITLEETMSDAGVRLTNEAIDRLEAAARARTVAQGAGAQPVTWECTIRASAFREAAEKVEDLAALFRRIKRYDAARDVIVCAKNIRALGHQQSADDELVDRFAVALKDKLQETRAKGKSGWDDPSWMSECQQALIDHLPKGDPRDVAAYCAFMWHHGWPTLAAAQGVGAQPVAEKLMLSQTCFLCGGRGEYNIAACPECKGAGHTTTELGYAAPSPDASRAEVEANPVLAILRDVVRSDSTMDDVYLATLEKWTKEAAALVGKIEAARREERERCFAAVRSVAMKPKDGDAAVEAHNAAIHDAEWAIRALGDRP